MQLKGKSMARDIACGSNHTLVLSSEGVYAWGANPNGQVGCQMEVVYSPRLVSFEEQIVKISAGADHSCFIDSKSRLYSCGKNNMGQLGVGNNSDQFLPMLVTSEIQQAAPGVDHTVLLTTQGKVYVTGSNETG